MKLLRFFTTLIVIGCFFAGAPAQAQAPTDEAEIQEALGQSPEELLLDENVNALDETAGEPVSEEGVPARPNFFRGVVVEVLEDTVIDIQGIQQPYQKVKVRLQNGPDQGKEVVVEHGGRFTIRESNKVKVGQPVVVAQSDAFGEVAYLIADSYRLTTLIIFAGLFFALTWVIARRRGLAALLGMALSVAILVWFIIPRILHGSDPLSVSLLGAFAIAVLSLTLAHGFRKQTYIALGSTLVTLLIAAGLALLVVAITRLSGFGSEEASYLQFGELENLNLQGLLLGGIIIGALGVLDDITTAQTAAVAEIRNANPNLSWRELFKRGSNVGREHIASLVNTLVLAYVGASFPTLLLLTQNTEVPLWVTLNGEMIAEEVVRALVGSAALVLAVPIATLAAAWFLAGKTKSPAGTTLPGHS